jgi:hypothetical protein
VKDKKIEVKEKKHTSHGRRKNNQDHCNGDDQYAGSDTEEEQEAVVDNCCQNSPGKNHTVENCADDERGGGEMAVAAAEDILPGIPVEGNHLRGGDDEAVVVLVVDKEIRILQELNSNLESNC